MDEQVWGRTMMSIHRILDEWRKRDVVGASDSMLLLLPESHEDGNKMMIIWPHLSAESPVCCVSIRPSSTICCLRVFWLPLESTSTPSAVVLRGDIPSQRRTQQPSLATASPFSEVDIPQSPRAYIPESIYPRVHTSWSLYIQESYTLTLPSTL